MRGRFQGWLHVQQRHPHNWPGIVSKAVTIAVFELHQKTSRFPVQKKKITAWPLNPIISQFSDLTFSFSFVVPLSRKTSIFKIRIFRSIWCVKWLLTQTKVFTLETFSELLLCTKHCHLRGSREKSKMSIIPYFTKVHQLYRYAYW